MTDPHKELADLGRNAYELELGRQREAGEIVDADACWRAAARAIQARAHSDLVRAYAETKRLAPIPLANVKHWKGDR